MSCKRCAVFVHIRHNFWCLIIASMKLKWYVYARSHFCKQVYKRNINDMQCNFLCLNFPPSKFFNLLLFFTNFSLFVLAKFALIKKCIISLAVTAVHSFFCKQLQLQGVETPKWSRIKQLLSTAQAQIVPRLKQLRLKLTSQKSTLTVAEY